MLALAQQAPEGNLAGDGAQYRISFDFDKGTIPGVYAFVYYTDGTASTGQLYTASGSHSFILTTPAGKAIRYLRFSTSSITAIGNYFYLDNVKMRRYETDSNYYLADVVTANDYSPFGAPMNNRSWNKGRAVVRTVAQYPFTADVNGWVPNKNNTTLSLQGQLLKVVAVSADQPVGIRTSMATKAGKTYRIRMACDFTVNPYVQVNDIKTDRILTKTGQLDYGYNTVEFTALGDSSIIRIVQNVTSSSTFWIDDITIEELESVGVTFGFNGKEMDNEASGNGNQYDYGFRIYNPRLARFLSVDPLTSSFPWYTPYQFAGNKPIVAIDLDGLEEAIVAYTYDKKGRTTQIAVTRIIDEDGNGVNMALMDANGKKLANNNVLITHTYANGIKNVEHQDQLTEAQQKVLDDNLVVNTDIQKGYHFNGYAGRDVPENGAFTYGVQKNTYVDKPTPARPSNPMFRGSPVAPGRLFAQGNSNWDPVTGALGATLTSFASGLSAQISKNPGIKSVNVSMSTLVGLSATASVLQTIQRGTQTAQNQLVNLIKSSVPSSVSVTGDSNANNRTTTNPSEQGTQIQLK